MNRPITTSPARSAASATADCGMSGSDGATVGRTTAVISSESSSRMRGETVAAPNPGKTMSAAPMRVNVSRKTNSSSTMTVLNTRARSCWLPPIDPAMPAPAGWPRRLGPGT